MQTLAKGVGGDLKRVLTNVKESRGILVEYQLQAILEKFIESPDQYVLNYW